MSPLLGLNEFISFLSDHLIRFKVLLKEKVLILMLLVSFILFSSF